jgi:N-methylhydantoinase A
VTDADLALGYLSSDSSLAGGVELDTKAASAALRRLGHKLGLDQEATAAGIVRVTNHEMVRALRVVTVERGIDPRRFALMPFGGAGPMHAAGIAAELDITRILCPRASGVLSALGLLASERRRDVTKTVLMRDLDAKEIAAAIAALAAQVSEGLEGAAIEVVCEMRYRGQAFELPVPASERPGPAELAEAFAVEHEDRYGYRDDTAPVELVNLRVAAVLPGPEPRPEAAAEGSLERLTRRAWFEGEWLETEVLHGEPSAGLEAEGPCVFELPEATLVLPPGWSAAVDDAGTVIAGAG